MSERLESYNRYLCGVLDLESGWSYNHKLQKILEKFLNQNEEINLESYNKYLCKSLNLESDFSYEDKLNQVLKKFLDSNPIIV